MLKFFPLLSLFAVEVLSQQCDYTLDPISPVPQAADTVFFPQPAQVLAVPCPALPASCRWATRADFENTNGYQNTNFSNTYQPYLNPQWYKETFNDQQYLGDFRVACGISTDYAASELDYPAFSLVNYEEWGPPRMNDLASNDEATDAPYNHSTMVCIQDPTTGESFSQLSTIDISTGIQDSKPVCSSSYTILGGSYSYTDGQVSASYQEGYTASLDVSTSTDAEYNWELSVSVSVTEGGSDSPLSSTQSFTASTGATIGTSNTTDKGTATSQYVTSQVTHNIVSGQECTIYLNVTVCQAEYTYELPVVLTGSFRGAFLKCNPQVGLLGGSDTLYVIDDYWDLQMRKTDTVLINAALNFNSVGSYYVTCTAPPTTTTTTAAPAPTLSVSTNARCGASSLQTCTGSAFGQCCSSADTCGDGDTYCSIPNGCQGEYGTCTLVPSTNGLCGGTTSETCTGSAYGTCCGNFGVCGSSAAYCAASVCDSAHGLCWSGSSSPVSTSSSSKSTTVSVAPPTTTTAHATTTTTKASKIGSTTTSSSKSTSTTSSSSTSLPISSSGRCGSAYGTCEGSTFGSCCSEYGYCGTNYANCGSGCRSGYGLCGVPIVQTTDGYCGVKKRTTCEGTKFGACCGNNGRCGNGAKFCSNGCYIKYGTCNST